MPSPEFEAAVAAVNGNTGPSANNETKLRFYALYKQATAGDAHGKRPGFTDFVGRAKYDAWAGLKGMSKADAEAGYISEANKL